ncbi:uncharacterized protein Z519_11817 [Cladophialophora bantiana CBS 173.52]|uniref:Heterokaryon incompatibility domain-containing protein n=1 Tax=Cladophialophora bantiana (strain ATCC 10958 / CBS 173.52 / CDC B-1940 / NIH 8579) TaxID=1442370 RepID=A0A0D2HSV0_CLAB1|nr:uncharacterized protein Z519_11817 [Cladophialophora bantiana CBS 173.52]KIW87494.1 hypothetical protein Z519_11817 [Cladophialophora bantiana CBS 173.52]
MNDTYRRWIRYCEDHPQTPTIPGNPPKAQDLCRRCLRLRKGIGDSLARLSKIENDYSLRDTNWEVAALDTPATWNPTQCALCYLFMTIHNNKFAEYDATTRYTLRAFKSYRSTGLAVLPTPSLDTLDEDCASSGFISRAAAKAHSSVGHHSVGLVGDHVDFSFIRSWIQQSGMNHTRDWSGLSLEDNPHFRLIDCSTGQIVKPPEACPYATLSYVWGRSDESVPDGDRLPKHLPRVVGDALTVAKRVGIPYLWVDRYCISQTDLAEKAAQIKKMGPIYSSASLTIFAAAGHGADHGLPGVSKKRANGRQPCAQVDRHLLTWTMPDGPALVLKSKWNTRAWTYQEMIFSGSRLIFTDLQVYMEQRWNVFHAEAWGEYPFSNIGRIHTHSSLTSAFNEIYKLNDYSRRQLSFSSDVIQAMQGLFNAMAHAKVLYQYMGALLPAVIAREGSPADDGALQYSFLWYHVRTSHRRQGFPSWSWAGWIGEVSYLELSGVQHWYHPTFTAESMEASVETTDGALTPWKEFRSMIVADRLPANNLSNFLHLNAYTVSLRFEWLDDPPQHSWAYAPDGPYRPGLYVRCHDSYAIYSPLQLSGDVDATGFPPSSSSSSWECLVLGQLAYYRWVGSNHDVYDKKFTDLCAVVLSPFKTLQPHRNGDEDGVASAERIGFVNLAHRVWDDECEQIRLATPKNDFPVFLRQLELQKTRTRIRLG